MEDHDFPGYANIEFQRKRYFVFDFFRADLEAMGRFGTMVSNYLRAEAGFRKQRLAAEGPQADDPSALRSEIAELQGGFRDILLRWLLVAFYGRFESFLFKFCRTLHQTDVCPMPPPFLKNIRCAKEYLEKLPNLRFPDGDAWRAIVDLGELRHAIAHENAILIEGKGRRREAVSRVPYTLINDRNEIWLEDGALEQALLNLRAFTDDLERAFGPTGIMEDD